MSMSDWKRYGTDEKIVCRAQSCGEDSLTGGIRVDAHILYIEKPSTLRNKDLKKVCLVQMINYKGYGILILTNSDSQGLT
jgi:hypothetical protein